MKARDLVKARLWCLDKDAWSVDLQFNPMSMTLTRESDPGDTSARAPYGGEPEWEGGRRDTLAITVLVDTSVGGEIDLADATAFERLMLSALSAFTESPNDESVLESVQEIYRLTMPIIPAAAADEKEARPPVVAFVWEQFEFMGFINSFECEFLLFDHNGKAKRATINLTFEGRAFSGGTTLEAFVTGAPPTWNTGDAFQGRGSDPARFDISDLE